MNKSVLLWVSISTLSLLSACGGQTSSSSMPLTADEEAGLVYMREEEELARDLYLDIFDLKPALTVFQTISNDLQSSHSGSYLCQYRGCHLPSLLSSFHLCSDASQ